MTSVDPIRRVAVLGAGTMGQGIAQTCAQAGRDVHLYDLNPDLAERGVRGISKTLDKAVELKKETPAARDAALARIRATADLAVAIADVDAVIEAAPEDLGLKRDLFRRVSELASGGVLLATNTSSLPVTEIAAATSRPERTLGLHFFNPVPRMKLLEIVVGERTAPAAVERARRFAEEIGKTAIVVKDSPGFASSRLGIAIAMEAIRMVEAGVASPADIDTAMKLGYGHPMGPLELTDLVGLDVRLAIADHLHREVGEQFRPPQLLRRLVRAGKLGRKSGEGFYTHGESARP
ncbi:MAG TPA: 3-hydroxyacyl-CoA dehydrogenase family protein [Planctomycetota bacterium]|nr:3-hydroxyacyl-CoA dehydrogenase family protein [Planctomycetota bacterium]